MQVVDINGNMFGYDHLEIIGADGKPKNIDNGLTSVGLSMPSAFTVSNSPLTSNGVIGVTGSGTISQYIDGTGALRTFPGLTGYVPYTGATQNVDLGEFELKAGQIELDQTPTGTAGVAVMRWNDQDGTADLGLKGGNVTLQIGQEQVTRVVNKTGLDLLEANYSAVRISGAQGNRIKVDLAQANNDANSADTLGLVTETILNNEEGFVTASGLVRNINTTGSLQAETWLDGDVLYLSGTVAGRITNIKPTAPIHTVIMGYVIRAHITQGQIYVKVDNGYELDELHNVYINPSTLANNDILQYDSVSLLWKNESLSAAGIQPTITLTTTGTGAATFISNVLNIPTPAAATFVSLTTTGSSGASTLISGVLNVPTYTLSGLGGVPSSRTLTINGTAYDLSADRSWSVGTVTSIATTGPITGGTITGSGTIGITQATISTDGYLNSTDWNIFNNKQNAITLTTTGTSGAATFIGSTLNIPQYQSVITNPVTGTGTTNYVARWTSSSQIGIGVLYDNGTNVGIGTTSPAALLELFKSTYPVLNISSGTITGNMGIDTGNSFMALGTTTNHDFSIVTNSTGRMRITSGGDVGIGTTSPGYSLHISRTSTQPSIIGTNTSLVAMRVGHGYDVSSPNNITAKIEFTPSALTNFYGDDITFSTTAQTTSPSITDASSERMRITSGGNVGIGTTSPGFKTTITADITKSGDLDPGTAQLSLEGASVPGKRMLLGYDTNGNGFGFIKAGNFNVTWTSLSLQPDGGNVGVGTTSPAALLNIYGTGTPTFALSNADTTGDGSHNVSIGAFKSGIGYNNLLLDAATYQFKISGTERMRITSTGDVGIGTSNPYEKLDIVGNIRLGNYTTSGTRYIGYANNTFASQFIAGMSIESTTVGGNYSQRLNFVTHNYGVDVGIRMTITEPGNVGIGNIAPGASLTVGTQSLASSGSGVAQDNSIIGRFGAANTAARVVGLTVANTATATIGNDATLSFIVASTYSATGLISTILQNTSVASTDMAFSVYDSSMQERMRIKANGNVGIGTTSPSAKLEVIGASTVIGQTNVSARFSDNTESTLLISHPASSGNTATITGNNQLAFATGVVGSIAERMRITSGGNVGIGTTSPSKKLHVKGGNDNVLFLDNGGEQYTSQYFANNGTTKSFLVWDNTNSIFEVGTAVSADLRFVTNNIERLRINSAGNVGIGTTSPSDKLEISGTGNSGIRISTTTNLSTDYASLRYYQNGAERASVYTNLGSYITNVNGAERMRITGAGDVLVGTTSSLHVFPGRGVIQLNGSSQALIGLSTGGTQAGYLFHNGTDFSNWNVRNGALLFATNNTEKMRITSTGTVGIGTTSPNSSAILHVSSTTKGFLPPSMTNTQMNGISLPASGLVVYDSTNNKLCVYNGTSWIPLH
jgi:hypothetical protein